MFADLQGLQSNEEEKKKVSSRFMFVFNYKYMHAHLFCVMYTDFSSPVQLLTEEKERLVKRKEAAKISEWRSSYVSQ